MNTFDIQNALDTQLATITTLPPLQTENTRFLANTNVTAFTRATLLPAQSAVISLGVGAQRQLSGIYQVDVFVPSDSGTVQARLIADQIVSTFAVGTRLISGDTTVIIDVASVMGSYSVNKYYCLPVRVLWSTYGQ